MPLRLGGSCGETHSNSGWASCRASAPLHVGAMPVRRWRSDGWSAERINEPGPVGPVRIRWGSRWASPRAADRLWSQPTGVFQRYHRARRYGDAAAERFGLLAELRSLQRPHAQGPRPAVAADRERRRSPQRRADWRGLMALISRPGWRTDPPASSSPRGATRTCPRPSTRSDWPTQHRAALHRDTQPTRQCAQTEAEPAQEPDQRALHDGTAVLNLIVSAALECAPNEPYRDVSEHPAILFATALPEHLRDHNRDISAVRECGNRRRSSRWSESATLLQFSIVSWCRAACAPQTVQPPFRHHRQPIRLPLCCDQTVQSQFHFADEPQAPVWERHLIGDIAFRALPRDRPYSLLQIEIGAPHATDRIARCAVTSRNLEIGPKGLVPLETAGFSFLTLVHSSPSLVSAR